MFPAGKKIRLIDSAVEGHRDIGEIFIAAEPTSHVNKMISEGFKLQSYITRDGIVTHSPLEYWESAEPASPIREITKREIVPGRYGAVHVIGLINIPDCNNPDVNPWVQVHIGIDATMSADELDAAASVLTQIAAVLRENQ